MELKGKTAIVTGAGRGIGEGIALVLAREGQMSFWTARKNGRDRCSRKEDRVPGRKGHAFKADSAKKADVQAHGRRNGQAVRGHRHFGGTMQGIEGTPCLTKDLSEEQWDRVLSVNLKGVFLCCQAVIPQMMKQGKGRIVNISSTAGIRMTFFGSVDYTVSKHGRGRSEPTSCLGACRFPYHG